MAKNNNLGDFLKGIADKIRTYLASDDLINPQDFESKITEVYDTGEARGIDEGKDAQYDAFWDAYQRNGGMCYWGGFQFYGPWWNDSNFYPKYDIYPGGGDSRSTFYRNAVSNLRERIDGRGLKVILPTGQHLVSWFREASTTEVPSMDTSNVTQFGEMFYKAANLVTVPRLNLTNAIHTVNTFKGATSLANITFEGTTKVSVDLSDCPLTRESFNSLLGTLDKEDYSGTRTITVNESTKTAFEEFTETGAWDAVVSYYAQYGNWTFALV